MVRSGYKDTYTNDESEFESQLIYNLAEFIRTESAAPWAQSRGEMPQDSRMTVMGALGSTRSVAETAWSTDMPANAADSLESSDGITSPKRHVHFNLPKPSDNHVNAEVRKELADLADAKEAGIAYVMGHSYVRAKPSSSWLKKFAINFVYSFLRRNCREPAVARHSRCEAAPKDIMYCCDMKMNVKFWSISWRMLFLLCKYGGIVPMAMLCS